MVLFMESKDGRWRSSPMQCTQGQRCEGAASFIFFVSKSYYYEHPSVNSIEIRALGP